MNYYWFIYDQFKETDRLILLKILFITRNCGLFNLINVIELRDITN